MPEWNDIEEPHAEVAAEGAAGAEETQSESVAQGALSAPAEAVAESEEAAHTGVPTVMQADYEDSFKPLKRGDIVSGLVVQIDERGMLVDVGAKSEGMVPSSELKDGAVGAEEKPVAVGDRIQVYVVKPQDENGAPILSKEKADYELAWQRIIDAYEKSEVISAMVTDRVKGGLVVDLGLRGFLPASHVATRSVHNLERFVGRSIKLKILEVDRQRKRVVVSNRQALDEERTNKRDQVLTALKEGDIRHGVVRRVTDYGAFVDIGGMDGLLHVTEMAWSRVPHPSSVVKVGQKLDVMVLKFDRETERISLGLKQILPDPWQQVQELYRVDQMVTGEVTRVVPFGAFVLLEGGIEGIIPNSEASDSRSQRALDVLKVGDKVQAKILAIKRAERRMTMSLRQASQDRDQRDYREYIDRQSTGGTVTIGEVVGDLFRRGEAKPSRSRPSQRRRPRGRSRGEGFEEEAGFELTEPTELEQPQEEPEAVEHEIEAEIAAEAQAEAVDEVAAEAEDELTAEAEGELTAEAEDEVTAEAEDQVTAEAEDQVTAEAEGEAIAEAEAEMPEATPPCSSSDSPEA